MAAKKPKPATEVLNTPERPSAKVRVAGAGGVCDQLRDWLFCGAVLWAIRKGVMLICLA